MSSKIENLAVQIVRFANENQPGWVECEFADAEGRKHRVVDKVPIFTTKPLDAGSYYPQSGKIRCTVLAEWRDAGGRELKRVATAQPDDVESTERLSEFVVLATQVSP
jgi:hypothetical protein